MTLAEVYKHLLNHFKDLAKSRADMVQVHDLSLKPIIAEYPDISLDRVKLIAIEAGLKVVDSVADAKSLPHGQMATYVVLSESIQEAKEDIIKKIQ